MSWTPACPLGASRHTDLCCRETTFQALAQLEYLDTQEAREIIICPGFIGASPETLTLIDTLNQHKENFKKSILALKQQKIPLSDPVINEKFEGILKKRPTLTAQTLQKFGLARLHLKQCYRIIPILPLFPLKISWTWANTRAIKRITRDEAEALLCKKKNSIKKESELEKLMTIPKNQSLAIVQDLAPHLRANIVLDNHKHEKIRMMIKGPIPLFFLSQKGDPIPSFKPPPPKHGKNKDRLKRSDQKIEQIPFLTSIRVHRYLD